MNFVLSKEAQAANAQHTYLSPVNREVTLPSEVAKKLPVGEGVLARLKQADWDSRDHRPAAVDAALGARDRYSLKSSRWLNYTGGLQL